MKKIIFLTIGIILFSQMTGFCYDDRYYGSASNVMPANQRFSTSKVQMPRSIPLPKKYVDLGNKYLYKQDEIYNIGKQLIDDKKFDLAIQFYTEFGAPKNPKIYNGIILACAAKGDIETAKELLKDINYPTNKEIDKKDAYFHLGYFLNKRGNLYESFQYFNHAAKLGDAEAQKYVTEMKWLANIQKINNYEDARKAGVLLYHLCHYRNVGYLEETLGDTSKEEFLNNLYVLDQKQEGKRSISYKGKPLLEYNLHYEGASELGFKPFYDDNDCGIYFLEKDTLLIQTYDKNMFKIEGWWDEKKNQYAFFMQQIK